MLTARIIYIQGFVEKWDSLIGWDLRAQGEGDFFINLLREKGVKRILDVSTGTGFHSIRLLQAGFEVVSADGSSQMLAKAFENGIQRNLVLRTVKSDWRWLNRDIQEQFDAVICLGNSFTHLFTESDRRKALAEFYAILEHDGMLILDQRNYDLILDQGFQSKHKYYYCGNNVKAETVGCHVTCLNLSEVQNERNRHLSQEQGLAQLIKVIDGSFEEIPVQDASYDLVWSQDAILHSGNRPKVIQEVSRILKSGGELIFTDIMQREDCPAGVLQPVLDRIHLETLGSLPFYRQVTTDCDMKEVQFLDLSQQLVNHYSHVLADMNQRYDRVVASCGTEYIDRMKIGLQHWIDAGEQGYLQWGILHFRKL